MDGSKLPKPFDGVNKRKSASRLRAVESTLANEISTCTGLCLYSYPFDITEIHFYHSVVFGAECKIMVCCVMQLRINLMNCLVCVVPYGNHGCSGGDTYTAFKYVIDNGGLDTESSYSFKGKVIGLAPHVVGFEVYTACICNLNPRSNRRVNITIKLLVPPLLGWSVLRMAAKMTSWLPWLPLDLLPSP